MFQPPSRPGGMKTDQSSWLPHRRLSASTSAPERGGTADEEELCERKEAAFRLLIAVSAAVSLGCVLALCLLVPPMYNYVDTMGAFSRRDFAYCEVRRLLIA